MVEGDRVAEEGVDDVGIIVQLLVNHKSKDAHLGSATIVKLNGKFFVDGFLVPTGGLQLGSLNVLLADTEANLNKTDEGNNLGNTSGGDGVEGC